MLKTKASLEVKGRNDKIYTLLCEPDAPLGELFDVIQCMATHIHQMMKKNIEQKKECDKEECLENCKEE